MKTNHTPKSKPETEVEQEASSDRVRRLVLNLNYESMKPYYYIYRVGGSHPKVRHATLKQAALESERLAGQHPGEMFEILKCLGVTQSTTPKTFWNDGVIPPTLIDVDSSVNASVEARQK